MAVEHSALTGDSIAEKLQIIKDATVDIKQAIIDKGGNVSGDISTWADAIRGIEGEKVTKYFHVFYESNDVDGYRYQYEDGMTWKEWINSEYNYNNFESNYGYIVSTSSSVPMIVCFVSSPVSETHSIRETTYTLAAGGMGNSINFRFNTTQR